MTIVYGADFEKWVNEIHIFNDRYLKSHPLYQDINTTCFHRKNVNAFTDMMGHLRALAEDKEFFEKFKEENKMPVNQGRKSIEQLLQEDIDRCQQYIENPTDHKSGIQLYIEITSRYDSIIDGFGNGLYEYYSDLHFYEPDISQEVLSHNLNVLYNKMITYQAYNYPIQSNVLNTEEKKQMSKKVFIVHGHDNEAKQEMARTLEKGGFEAIILHEQPDYGDTIIEKIERNSDVCFAVVLYTECDIGRDKNNPVEKERFRARQNVVFEHGYLIGKLGRSRVNALVKGDIETPGDISGVVYIPMDNAGAWKMKLAQNMKAVNLSVNLENFFF